MHRVCSVLILQNSVFNPTTTVPFLFILITEQNKCSNIGVGVELRSGRGLWLGLAFAGQNVGCRNPIHKNLITTEFVYFITEDCIKRL